MFVEINLSYTIHKVVPPESAAEPMEGAIGNYRGLCEVRPKGVMIEPVIKHCSGPEGRFYDELPDCVKIVVQSLRAEFITKLPYKARCTRTMYSTEFNAAEGFVRQRVCVEVTATRISIPRIG